MWIIQKHRIAITQMLFFGLVGLVTFCIDVGVSLALFHLIGLPVFLASGIGFASGFFFNFPMNRKRVFHHSDLDRFQLYSQVIMYIALSIFNLVSTSWMVDVMVEKASFSIQASKVLVTAMIAVWNFLIFKYLIFSKK